MLIHSECQPCRDGLHTCVLEWDVADDHHVCACCCPMPCGCPADPVLFLATLSTYHYEFQALAATADDARNALRDTWNRHRAQYHAADRWEDLADDVNMQPLRPAHGYRDGSVTYCPTRDA